MTEKAGLEIKKKGKEKLEEGRPGGARLFKSAWAVEAATRIRGAADMLRASRRAAHMPSFALTSHTLNIGKHTSFYLFIFSRWQRSERR